MFRILWLTQFASNVGMWMQAVAAQWLMGSLSSEPILVALLQTAMTLPFFLTALPAGALGDIVPRRQLLLRVQAAMAVVAAALAALAFLGAVTPTTLLLATLLLGVGQAVMWPSWQGMQPDLVDRAEIREAVALGGVSMNLGRAVGPACGGLLVAVAGPSWVFMLNGVSFILMCSALAAWRPVDELPAHGESRLRPAMREGLAYVRSSGVLRSAMARCMLFSSCAGGLWALLPVLSRDELRMGSGGYGLLLGLVGIGAVLGAALLPALRQALPLDGMVLAWCLVSGVACVCLVWVGTGWAAAPCVGVMGAGWIGVMTSLNGLAQLELPRWVRTRGMAVYLIAAQGGQAVAGFTWGAVTQVTGVRVAFAIIGGALVLGGFAGPRFWSLGPEVTSGPRNPSNRGATSAHGTVADPSCRASPRTAPGATSSRRAG
jgi:MFS family permease